MKKFKSYSIYLLILLFVTIVLMAFINLKKNIDNKSDQLSYVKKNLDNKKAQLKNIHNKLLKKIIDKNLPLIMCRSKSGGVHIFLFSIEFQYDFLDKSIFNSKKLFPISLEIKPIGDNIM